MKSIKFTNTEIEKLKDMLNASISYMLETGVGEDYCEVRACKSLIEKLEKGE
jgi:hypothetical protein